MIDAAGMPVVSLQSASEDDLIHSAGSSRSEKNMIDAGFGSGPHRHRLVFIILIQQF